MAQYDALRDAFGSFNKMLLDSQQWEEKHAAIEADRQFKHTILKGDMMQREFQNQMAKNDYKLRERGESRIADSQKFQQDMSIKNYNLAKAQAGRDQTKLEQATATFQQQMQINAVAAHKANQLTTEAPLSFTGVLSPDDLANPKIMEPLKQHLAPLGMTVGPDGIAVGQDGKPVQMKPLDQGDFTPFISGLKEMNNDGHANTEASLSTIQEQSKQLKSVIATAKGPYGWRDRAGARVQLASLNAEASKLQQFYTPRGQIQYQTQKVQSLANSANWARQRGQEDAAKAMETKALKHLDALEALRKGQNVGEGNALQDVWATELKDDGSAQWVGKGVYNKNNNTWTMANSSTGQLMSGSVLPNGLQAVKPTERIYKPNELAGSDNDTKMAAHIMKGFENVRKTITPQLSLVKAGAGENAAAEQGQTFYNEIVNAEEPVMRNGKPVLNEDGTPKMRSLAPKNGPEVIQAQKEAERMLVKAHNQFADMYMKAEAKYSTPDTFGGGRTVTADMQTWIDEIYRPKIEQAGFTYLPVEKYRYQVRGTD